MTDVSVASYRAGQSEIITVRLEPEIAERVARAAAADGRTVSGFVRKVLLDRLAEVAG